MDLGHRAETPVPHLKEGYPEVDISSDPEFMEEEEEEQCNDPDKPARNQDTNIKVQKNCNSGNSGPSNHSNSKGAGLQSVKKSRTTSVK